MGDIILEREGDTQIMKLDADEQALMDEIAVAQEKKISVAPAIGRKPNFKTKPQPKKTRRVMAEEIDAEIDAFTNPVKKSAPPPMQQGGPPMFDDSDEDEPPHEYAMSEYSGDEPAQYSGDIPSKGYSSIDEEKADILNRLTRLEKKGFNVNKKLNAYSTISDLRTEYKRITYSIEVDSSIKFSRKMMVACASGIEFLNKRYNPVDIYLEGWSESIVENLDDYDGVFEELYNKYKTKMQVAPEVKLIMMIGGSAMMFHLTNSMFKAAIPNMNDVLKQNPDLVKNMVDAVKNTQGGGGGGAPPPAAPTFGSDGRREMRGPGIDLSSLMGGMMPPPPPVNTSGKTSTLTPVEESDDDDDDDISDIVSISGELTGGEFRDVTVTAPKRRGRRQKSKKNEISI